ncbi:hypothetical protein RxyAA322_22560 [Rubrobacter xylanophilus]|uniref:DUF302 domain-containing protein n=1 Tax=Rubrobacter xylanophilus TaxID=49319 RepID=A0A510HKA2_9ACTN|nr:DUF302 domain-containing protein [Rubrobacter xylanophilus]BBL80402.1 hypothetical protein RxyAA322_22560 [Rubrobacter xylanophilus]
MAMERTGYTISGETSLAFGEAVERVRELLQQAGYGVLCEIDVKAKLEEKLGVEREPYTILGACNPPLAREGLDAEPELGALLPCNVVVYEREGRTRVAAVEPRAMLSVVGNEKLDRIAARVREDLARVVEQVADGERRA